MAVVVPTPNQVAGTYQSTSLYVGDLPGDVSEGHLFEIFNTVGPVASIRVCRDAVTRRSLGYAYVNFHSPADAERALDTMNNSPIKGKACRIMWSQRDPSIRKSGVGNIFIKNLDKSIDHKALYDTFSDFGNILSCKVAVGSEGESKGYGFVHYETQEMADNAIEKVNSMLLGDKKVFVGKFVPKKERMQNRYKNFTNVYVKNLPLDVSDEEFRARFEEHGPVTSAVVRRTEDGKSRGFGFVNYEHHEGATAAVEKLNGSEWGDGKTSPDGKKLFVGRAQKKSERQQELRAKFAKIQQERAAKYQGVNVYIKNLDDEFDDEWLRTEFSRFGTITSVRIMRDDKSNSKGFGFVCFTTPDEATKAVTEMHSRVYGNKPIYVALAQPKDLRRAHLEAQYAQRLGKTVPRAGYPAQTGMAPMGYPGNQAPPVYYPQGQVPPQSYVYGAQQMNRGAAAGWNGAQANAAAAAAAAYRGGSVPVAYGVPMAQRGGPRGGRGGHYPRAAGGRPGPQQMAVQGATPTGSQPQAQVAQQPGQAPAPEEQITVEFLHKMQPEDQFLYVSQRLYPIIQQQQPKLAPKITGMLRSWYLESQQGPEELIKLLQNPKALNAKITEALEVWNQHLEQQAQAGENQKDS